jgi:hydroxyacyl-ACP dehydratase HTD2-like protein with hotdog domain
MTRLRYGATIERQITPDEADLFRFSAALSLPHLIHYNTAYAVADGHADLLVHGPLQGAYLVELVEKWLEAENGFVVGFRYRHVAPAYVNQPLACHATVTGRHPARRDAEHFDNVELAVEARDAARGRATTVGTVTGLVART